MDDNGKCCSCKHWVRRSGFYGPHGGECHSAKLMYQADEVPIDALVYWDYEGYSASLMTGAHFGCVHHVAVTGGVK